MSIQRVPSGSASSESEATFSETASNTRLSFASSAAVVSIGGDDAFKDAVKEARGQDDSGVTSSVRDTVKSIFTLKGAFLCSALLSSFSMCAFAGVTMQVVHHCKVFDATQERCCSCLQVPVNNTQETIGDQVMPKQDSYNNVFYGVTIIMNALFGIMYTVEAIKNENKYQLVFAVISQIIGIIRSGVDVLLETRIFHSNRFAGARIAFVVLSLGSTIVSLLLVYPLMGRMSWVLFRRVTTENQRLLYKMYQLARGLNWLEIQASSIVFASFAMFLGYQHADNRWWILSVFVFLDIISSRQLIHHVKRENLFGCLLAITSKIVLLVYCGIVAFEYFTCREEFLDSLHDTLPFWRMKPWPNLESVTKFYNGLGCLGPHTTHDDRTAETMIISFTLLVVFRLGLLFVFVRILFQFGRGLKGIFYKNKKKKSGLGDGDDNSNNKNYSRRRGVNNDAASYSPYDDDDASLATNQGNNSEKSDSSNKKAGDNNNNKGKKPRSQEDIDKKLDPAAKANMSDGSLVSAVSAATSATSLGKGNPSNDSLSAPTASFIAEHSGSTTTPKTVSQRKKREKLAAERAQQAKKKEKEERKVYEEDYESDGDVGW